MRKKFDSDSLQYEDDMPKNVGKGVMIAYGILLLHLVLLLGIGFLVLFLQGLVNYASVIFIAGILLLGVFGFFIFRKFRKNRGNLEEILRHPDFADRNLEIRLLGGLASVRVGDEKEKPRDVHLQNPLMLESPQGFRIRELTELGIMYEKNLLTLEEYELAKKQIFRNFRTDDDPHVLVEFAQHSKNPEAE